MYNVSKQNTKFIPMYILSTKIFECLLPIHYNIYGYVIKSHLFRVHKQ